jgi:hypothetical protein
LHTAINALEPDQILSGGYNWDSAEQPEVGFWRKPEEAKVPPAQLGRWNGKLNACIAAINDVEHSVRGILLNKGGARRIYWPEPNLYMAADDRQEGARKALGEGTNSGTDSQQLESIYYVSGTGKRARSGVYNRDFATTKPLKNYFGNLRELIVRADDGVIERDRIVGFIKGIRQTHLDSKLVLDKLSTWYGVDAPVETAGTEIRDGLEKAINSLARRLLPILNAPR